MKPGIKTTEFWIALVVALMAGAAAAFGEEQWAKIAGILAMALTSVGYSASRAKVKQSSGPIAIAPIASIGDIRHIEDVS